MSETAKDKLKKLIANKGGPNRIKGDEWDIEISFIPCIPVH